MNRLLVIIVNYKTSNMACETVEKLLPQLDEKLDRVTIIDNNSADDSSAIITEFIKCNKVDHIIDFIDSSVNGGFSYGNNQAIRHFLEKAGSLPEYVLFLNPDTLVCDGAISTLLNFMQSHPEVGIAGSRLEGVDGQVQNSSFRFPSLMSELDSSLRLGLLSQLLSRWKITAPIESVATVTDWVAGASMIVRSKVFDDIGLMDEDYFLYFEETDFCLQAKRKGWQCWYVPDSRVIHFVGQSTGVISGDELCTRRPRYWFESRQRYFIKNYGTLYTILVDFIWGVSFSIWRLRRFIQRKPDVDPINMLFDFWRNSIFFSKIGR